MTIRSHATGGTLRVVPWWAAAAVAVLLAGLFVGSPDAGAQDRRVVVVGDSVVLGAQSALIGGFQGAGWQITFDAEVSRSTVAAVDAVESHRAELTDSLVLSFGANDAGNPATFRTRVERVVAATASVPNVYWLTIREVRDYYPAANQVLRDVAARHPNVTIVDWHGASAGSTGLTADDGLHLTGAGGARLAELLVGAVVSGVVPAAQAPQPSPPSAPQPPITEQPETTVVPTTAAPTRDTPTIAPIETTTTEAQSTTDAPDDASDRAVEIAEVEDTSTVGVGGAVGWTAAAGLVLVLAILVGAGLGLGAWSLYSTRGRGRRPAAAAPPPSPQHPAVRARQRAERIAAAAHAADVSVEGDRGDRRANRQ